MRAPLHLVLSISVVASIAPQARAQSVEEFYRGKTIYALVGVAAGGMLQLRLQIWPDYFGRRNIATLRGYTAPFDLMGGVGGPFFAAWVYDQSHSYHTALLVFTILSGINHVRRGTNNRNSITL